MPQSVPSLPRRVARMLRTSLFAQVGVALVLGIVVGRLWPDAATTFQPLGDGFIKLVKMLIAPIVFATIAVGIAQMGEMKQVGRIGLVTLIYFEITTVIALLIGLVVVSVLRPGAGVGFDPTTADVSSIAAYTSGAQASSGVSAPVWPAESTTNGIDRSGWAVAAATIVCVAASMSNRSIAGLAASSGGSGPGLVSSQIAHCAGVTPHAPGSESRR